MNEKRIAKAKEISTAALQLFAAKGYAATSVEEIAAAANIGKSTVYEYYATKEKLFVEAIINGAERLIEDLQAIGRETMDVMQQLRKIAGLYVKEQSTEFALESKLFIEFLSQALLNGGAFFELRPIIQNLYQRVVRILVDYLLAGISQGQLRPDIARDVEKIAINYLAYLDGIKVHSMLADNLVNVRDQIDFYLNNLTPLMRGPETNQETKV